MSCPIILMSRNICVKRNFHCLLWVFNLHVSFKTIDEQHAHCTLHNQLSNWLRTICKECPMNGCPLMIIMVGKLDNIHKMFRTISVNLWLIIMVLLQMNGAIFLSLKATMKMYHICWDILGEKSIEIVDNV